MNEYIPYFHLVEKNEIKSFFFYKDSVKPQPKKGIG